MLTFDAHLLCQPAYHTHTHTRALVHCSASCQSTCLSFHSLWPSFILAMVCFVLVHWPVAFGSCYKPDAMQTAFKSILMFSFQLKSYILDLTFCINSLSWRRFFSGRCCFFFVSFDDFFSLRERKQKVFCLFTVWLVFVGTDIVMMTNKKKSTKAINNEKTVLIFRTHRAHSGNKMEIKKTHKKIFSAASVCVIIISLMMTLFAASSRFNRIFGCNSRHSIKRSTGHQWNMLNSELENRTNHIHATYNM